LPPMSMYSVIGASVFLGVSIILFPVFASAAVALYAD
jgi:hypothetical protein